MEKPILIGFIFKQTSKREKNIAFFLLGKVKSDLILTKFREKVRILTISEKSDLATHSGIPSKS